MKNFHFIKNKKVTLIILAAVLVIGLASFFIRGFNIDIDFSGGTEMKIDLGVEVTDDVAITLTTLLQRKSAKSTFPLPPRQMPIRIWLLSVPALQSLATNSLLN